MASCSDDSEQLLGRNGIISRSLTLVRPVLVCMVPVHEPTPEDLSMKPQGGREAQTNVWRHV